MTEKLMKNLSPALVALLSACLLPAVAGCTLFTPKNAETALEVGKALCIIANAQSDDQTVKTVCGILSVEDAAVRAILNEHRREARRYAETRNNNCVQAGAPDAGTASDAGAVRK